MSTGSVGTSSGSGKTSKRSFAAALDEGSAQITTEQLEVLRGVAAVDFTQDLTGSSLQAARIRGLMELVEVDQLSLGRHFMAPVEAPSDGEYSFEFFAHTSWVIFVLEQDLSSIGHGVLVKIAGTMDSAATLFPSSGSLVIKQPVKKYLVARLGMGGVLSPLQMEINRVLAASGPGTSMGTAAVGVASSSTSGASPPMKKAAFASVLDINLEEQLVTNKEGAAAKVRTVAALIREMAPQRREYLCPDWEFNVDTVQERLLSQSERSMVMGEEMFAVGQLQRLMWLTVWTDKVKFEGWFLGRLPSGSYSLSLWDFKGPESSGWGFDMAWIGRSNLLEAVGNVEEFLRILKGDAFRGVMNPIRDLWIDPGALVQQYHAVFLQFYLERMMRDYYQDITQTSGKTASLIKGQALGGQAEAVALLRTQVDNFVTLVRGRTLEVAPHTAFYGDPKWIRISYKPPYSTAAGKSGVANGGSTGGGVGTGSGAGSGVRAPVHREGLCVWMLADMLGLKNKTGGRFECRATAGSPPIAHSQLSRVRKSAVLKMLEDPQFLNGARDGLKNAIIEKIEADPKVFRKE